MKSKTKLIVVGTGSFAREVLQLIRIVDPLGDKWGEILLSSDNASELGHNIRNCKVAFCDTDLKNITEPYDVVLGVGKPLVRSKLSQLVSLNANFTFPNLIHPSVEIDHSTVRFGHGNIVCKGAVFSVDIQFGNFNLVNWNATIGHDVSVGNCSVINPSANISGKVAIENCALIGVGAQVLENIVIKNGTLVGAGAVVTRSHSEENVVLVGIPAKNKLETFASR